MLRVMPCFMRPYTNPALKLSPAPMVLTVSTGNTAYSFLNPSSAMTISGSQPRVQMNFLQ